jgi:hypothetical protein
VVSSNCQECSDLVAAYHNAIAALVERGKRLAEVADSRERDLYKRLLEEYQGVFSECKALRKQLLIHLKSHSTPKTQFRPASKIRRNVGSDGERRPVRWTFLCRLCFRPAAIRPNEQQLILKEHMQNSVLVCPLCHLGAAYENEEIREEFEGEASG